MGRIIYGNRSRKRATAVGAEYYNTGIPCGKCGKVRARVTATGKCTYCEHLKKQAVYMKKRRTEKKEEMLEYQKEYYRKNKDILAKRQIEYSSKPASYKSFRYKLASVDNISMAENGDLLVSCYYCDEQFTPTRHQVSKRIEAIEGKITIGTQNNFYCSDSCKSKCKVFGKTSIAGPEKFDTDLLAMWSFDVKKKAGWKCEICGRTSNLHSHHILPKSTNPVLAYDIENGMCLCKSCHFTHGHRDECSQYKLAQESCQNFSISLLNASAASLV